MPIQIKFEPIVAKRRNYPVDIVDRLELFMGDALNGPIRRALIKSFEARVIGWQHRPSFGSLGGVKFRDRGGPGNLTGMSITIGPKGTNKRFWVFVSVGTKPHPISPKRGKFLRIRGGYQPHTRKGRFGGAGLYVGDVNFVKFVPEQHIEGRGFERDIADENAGFIFRELSLALARAVR